MASPPPPHALSESSHGLPPPQQETSNGEPSQPKNESQEQKPNVAQASLVDPSIVDQTQSAAQLNKPKPVVSTTKKKGSQNIQTKETTSRTAQPPPPPTTTNSPVQPNAATASSTLKKPFSSAKQKITNNLQKSALKSQKLDTAQAANSKKTDSVSEKPPKPTKSSKKDQAEAVKPTAKQPQAPALRDLSQLPASETPSADIVAVHEPGQPLETAWAYIPEKSFSKRPILSPAPAYPGGSWASRPTGVRQRSLSLAGPTSLQAGLESLNQEFKYRDERESDDKDRIANWGANIPSKAPPYESVWQEKVEKQHALPDIVQRADELGDDLHTPLRNENLWARGVDWSGRPSSQTEEQKLSRDVKRSHDEDLQDIHSRPSSRPSSKTGSKSKSEKEKSSKIINWLTDRTMLSGNLDQARVLAFEYPAFKPPPPKAGQSAQEPEHDKYLTQTTEALLDKLRKKRASSTSDDPIPIVFVASGFGCAVVMKMITLMATLEDRGSTSLEDIASIMLLDVTSAIKNEKSTNSKAHPGTNSPVPAMPMHSPTIKSNMDPQFIYTSGVWSQAQEAIGDWGISTVWFYTSDQTKSLPSIGPTTDIELVKLETSASTTQSAHAKQPPPRFRGPQDPNYNLFLNHFKRSLLFWASTHRGREKHLEEFIKRDYKLDLVDRNRQCCLHKAAENHNDAAMYRLVNSRPDLASARDKEGSTPLHVVVKAAIGLSETDDDAVPVKMMIERLRLALAETQHNDDDLKDSSDKLPVDYAPGDEGEWIRKRCEHRVLLAGTRAAQPDKIQHPMKPLGRLATKACKTLKATLAQFYIATDYSSDYFDPQRPAVHTILYDDQYGIEELFQRNLRSEDGKSPTCRWIHLPANNEKWVHDLFAQQFRRIDKSTGIRRHRGPAPFDRHITPDALRYRQIHDPLPKEGYFQRGTSKKMVTALFMPVFGFEKHKNRMKLSRQMKNPSQENHDETSVLLHAYFSEKANPEHKQLPLHCRRTLDQFTYHMLEDTERRDVSQVMFRWAKREAQRRSERELQKGETDRLQLRPPKTNASLDSKDKLPLLMIDQLWLWVLEDESTVITSLPNVWEQTENYNLERYLRQRVLSGNDERGLIEGPLDLANTIIRGSIDFLHRPGPLNITMYECFKSSITLVSEKQAQQFQKFETLIKRLNAGELAQQERAELTNQLFQLTTETRLLVEIIDIQDELKTSLEVLIKQRDTLDKFVRLLTNEHGQDKTGDDISSPDSSIHASPSMDDIDPLASLNSPTPWSIPQSALRRDGGSRKAKSRVQFSDKGTMDSRLDKRSKPSQQAKENLQLVESNISTIKEMTTYAKKIQTEINGLLSHRQKQANLWEARFAREGSEYTQRQSNITLVFTMVTVFFLPLSFMASVFAIQIDAYPHNDETGEVSWPLRDVMGLLFGVSFGIIFFVALLGFYINDISHIFSKYLKPKRSSSGPSRNRDSHHDFLSDSGDTVSDINSDSSDTIQDTNSDIVQRDQRTESTRSESGPYARLFGLWQFHTKIPWVRRLWAYRDYGSERRGKRHTSTLNSDDEGSDGDSINSLSDASSTNTWGPDDRGRGSRRDYPLHRFMRPISRFAQRWPGKKGQIDDEMEDDDGNVSLSSSLQRENRMATAEEGWGAVMNSMHRRSLTQGSQRG